MLTPRNLLTDVAGLTVGNAHDVRLRSGVTVLLAERPLTAAVDVRGGGPGTRETDALGLAGTVETAHAFVLSGGSAFGLAAATGVQSWLAERGVGFAIGPVRVPIVPQAIVFDLLNGGDKQWGRQPPYERLAIEACDAAGVDFALGSAGGGYGATTAGCKGGLGSASAMVSWGATVGALVVVNAVGSVTIGDGPHFWAAPFEVGDEFGGHGQPARLGADDRRIRLKGGLRENTTIAVVATDARLSKPQCHRLAIAAQTGLARAIHPVHTPLDGDVVFAAATGDVPLPDPHLALAELGAVAAMTLARAVARGVFEAASFGDAWPSPPAYRDRFPR
jgi:D-aminopeptidase